MLKIIFALLLPCLAFSQTHEDVVNEYKKLEESVDTNSKEYKKAYREIYDLYKDQVKTLHEDKYLFHWRTAGREYYRSLLQKNGTIPLHENGLISSAKKTAYTFYYNHIYGYGNAGAGLYAAIDPFATYDYGYASYYGHNSMDEYYTLGGSIPVLLMIKIPKETNFVLYEKEVHLGSVSANLEICSTLSRNFSSSLYAISQLSQACKLAYYHVTQDLKISLFSYHYHSKVPNPNGPGTVRQAFVIIDQDILTQENVYTLSRNSRINFSKREKRKLRNTVDAEYLRNSFSYGAVVEDIMTYFPEGF